VEYRRVTIFTGAKFDVPTHIQRIDTKATHGWQLRYGRSKMFSDHTNDGAGASESLEAATAELAKRVARLPAPTGLRSDVLARKGSDLPVGISGPREVRRPNKNVAQYYLQVTYPIVGARPANRQVYIATENTYTDEKFQMALAKAIALRDTNVRKYKLASTRLKRELANNAGIGDPS
jgi:hypothetical protein